MAQNRLAQNRLDLVNRVSPPNLANALRLPKAHNSSETFDISSPVNVFKHPHSKCTKLRVASQSDIDLMNRTADINETQHDRTHAQPVGAFGVRLRVLSAIAE